MVMLLIVFYILQLPIKFIESPLLKYRFHQSFHVYFFIIKAALFLLNFVIFLGVSSLTLHRNCLQTFPLHFLLSFCIHQSIYLSEFWMPILFLFVRGLREGWSNRRRNGSRFLFPRMLRSIYQLINRTYWPTRRCRII